MRPAEAECPRCRAQLDVETLVQSRAKTCPFCEADVSALLADWSPAITESREPGEMPSAGDWGNLHRPLPAGSRLQVVPSEDGQLVVFIPPGGIGVSGLKWFAVFFNAIVLLISAGFVAAWLAPAPQAQRPPWGVFLGLGLFWLIGLGLGWAAVRLKFAKTLLAVDHQRAVLKTILFGRSRQQELSLENGAECGLREAYAVNDVPVYAVEVGNGENSVRFGTNLGPEDKEWLLNEIQHRLGRPDHASGRGSVQAELAGRRVSGSGLPQTPESAHSWQPEHSDDVAPLLASQLPPETPIRLLEETPQCLSFWFPVMPNPFMRVVMPLLLLGFMGVWMILVGWIAGQMWQAGQLGVPGQIMAVAMLAFGLILIGMALMVAFGHITVRLTREELWCRASLGPFGRQRAIPVSEIELMYLTRDVPFQPRHLLQEHPRQIRLKGTTGAIVVAAPERYIVVASTATSSLARQVAGLLKQKLETWGHPLLVQWVDPVRSESP